MDAQLRQDDNLRNQQKLIHDGRNWRNIPGNALGIRETDAVKFAEIDRLFRERYENARNPVNIPLKIKIQMKQEAYETKKDTYLGVTFAPKLRHSKKKNIKIETEGHLNM